MPGIDDLILKGVREMIERKEEELAELKEFWFGPKDIGCEEKEDKERRQMNLEATRQLVITTRCPDSPTEEHVWVSGDVDPSDFCKYCGASKFLKRLDVLAAKTTKNIEKRIQRCKDASTSPRPKGIIFKRCPFCKSRLTMEEEIVDFSIGSAWLYYTCLNCEYVHGCFKEK
jgi:hypothetical protein